MGYSAENIENTERFNLSLTKVEASLREKIRHYLKIAAKIEAYLSRKPSEWGRFQIEFNQEVDNIFRDIMHFEKENHANNSAEKAIKLKKLFINRLRKIFLKGAYNKWSLDKPYGYAGDFRIIDDIYQNVPITTGFNRLFDNYFQMSAISVAVRNRKNDFKRMLVDFINERKNCPLRIMDLASGPCRDIKEILCSNNLENHSVVFDCYDHEPRALQYAQGLLAGFENINFIQENALRIAAVKDITSLIPQKYDFIYSTGLFDYLNHKISLRLIKNLKQLLNDNGILAISNVREKYSNPSMHYMEWVGDWNLVYRCDEEFRSVFLEAGFADNELNVQYEQQGVMQYIIATQRGK